MQNVFLVHRAYATELRLSVVVVVCDFMYCGLTVRPRANVTIDRLQEVAHKKSIGNK